MGGRHALADGFTRRSSFPPPSISAQRYILRYAIIVSIVCSLVKSKSHSDWIQMAQGKKGIRFQPTLRKPLAEEVIRLAELEGRTDSEMVAQLVDEAVKDRASKGLAQVV